jgi:tyrosinase
VDLVKPDDGIDMTQISIIDAETDTIFHLSIRWAQGQIDFKAKFGGWWGEEERINIDHRFDSEDGATILIHDQGDGFEVSIDWVHAVWFAQRAQDSRTLLSIWYDIW